MAWLTYGEAQTLLENFASADVLDDRINQAVSRLVASNRWPGMTQQIAITATQGVIALPNRFSAILGASIWGNVYPIASGFFSFLPGKLNVDNTYSKVFEDQGSGFATLVDCPVGGSLQIQADTGNVVTIYGRGADGMPVKVQVTGVGVPPAQYPNQPFYTIDRITKSATVSSAVITQTSSTGVITTLAVMEPHQTNSEYHRYYFSYLKRRDSDEPQTVCALVRLGYVYLSQSDDLIPITSMSALQLAMRSLQAESENDNDRADRFFSSAIAVLNREALAGRSPDEFGVPRVRFVAAEFERTRPMW